MYVIFQPTEYELTHTGVFWSVCMGVSVFCWEKWNFRDLFIFRNDGTNG